MKRFVVLVAFLVSTVLPSFPYSPPRILPDTANLPAILDSTISYLWDNEASEWDPDNGGKWVYIYDHKGNTVSGINSWWDSENTIWKLNSRILYTHDPSGNLIDERSFNWDSDQNEWTGDSHTQFEYNSSGNQIEERRYSWEDEYKDWIGDYREQHLYDTLGFLIEENRANWDESIAGWIWESRTLKKYDSSGKLTEESNYDWDTEMNVWINDDRYQYIFDSAANLIEENRFSWSKEKNEWNGVYRYLYSYNLPGLPVEEITFKWDKELKEWVNSDNYQFTYDSTGNRTWKYRSKWDKVFNEWALYWRNQYTYDPSGNQTGKYYARWDEELKVWKWESRDLYTWDYSGNQTGHYMGYWEPEDSTWVWSQYHQFVFDSSGNLTSDIPNSWNSEKGVWLGDGIQCHRGCTGGRHDYVFDIYGNQVEHFWMDWNPDLAEWVDFSKASSCWSYLHDSLLLDQIIRLDENSDASALKWTMMTGKGYLRDSMHFSITGGDPDHLFRIDETTGDLLPDPSFNFDYETSSGYDLIVEALLSDSEGTKKDPALISIRVNNMNDNVPVIEDTMFYLGECLDHSRLVYKELGNLRSFDADGDLNPLIHTLVSGNENGIFYLNRYTGALSVRYDSIDYEKQASYYLAVKVTDGTFSDQATVTVQVNDLVETATEPGSVREVISQAFTLFPNPTSGMVNLDFPNTYRQGTVVEVKDMDGRIRLIRDLTDRKLDLSSLPAGVYFITIRSADFVTTGKVLKL